MVTPLLRNTQTEYRKVNLWLVHQVTLVAFFKWRALSFWMSCHERMGVFSSSPTTIPGPWVGGPPMNSIRRAPVLGKAPWGSEGGVLVSTICAPKCYRFRLYMTIFMILQLDLSSLYIIRWLQLFREDLEPIDTKQWFKRSHVKLILSDWALWGSQ